MPQSSKKPLCASTIHSTSSLFAPEIQRYHLSLLGSDDGLLPTEEVSLAPIITSSTLAHLSKLPGASKDKGALQFGFLAGSSEKMDASKWQGANESDTIDNDPRVLFNVSAPSSTFICGSQGSGKSHTLSCMLEACLIESGLGKLVHPLSGVVFHYDTFISDDGGSPCEAAFLASHEGVRVRVLCAPTNLSVIKKTYRRFEGITVEPLQLDEKHLNTKRMMDLMAVGNEGPLYMETVKRILREMRLLQQQNGGGFNYQDFIKRIDSTGMTPNQMSPLNQRLDILESFMPVSQTARPGTNTEAPPVMNTETPPVTNTEAPPVMNTETPPVTNTETPPVTNTETPPVTNTETPPVTNTEAPPVMNTDIPPVRGTDWSSVPGQLTIVDLSCPCITPETACSLFNICLGLFIEPDQGVGRVIALDEAHKYMGASPEAAVFTDSLLSVVRLQRHLGIRVIVSTQEPTVSPALLNLCSVTLVHRFTSPEWLRILQHHLAAAAEEKLLSGGSTVVRERECAPSLFSTIVNLKVGEALLFAPSAIIGVDQVEGRKVTFLRLAGEHMRIKVRARLTDDGGKSVLSL